MTAPMHETVSSREKVEHWLALAMDAGLHKQDFNLTEAADAILAALASSGDHAELARLAEAAAPYWHAANLACGGNPIAVDLVTPFVGAMSPSICSALLAENTALRAENEKHRNLVAGMVDKFEQQHDRATEAERKLAEAVGLLRRIEGMCPATCETSLAHDMAQIASEWLSKEAERG